MLNRFALKPLALPYILDDVLPQISAGNDECFAQGQFARAPGPFIPRLFE